MPTCCAPGCTNTEKSTPDISFFNLPWNNKQQLKVWLGKLRLLHRPAKSARICQIHFEEKFLHVDSKYLLAPDLYKRKRTTLSEDAAPTIFAHVNYPRERQCSLERSRKRQKTETLNALRQSYVESETSCEFAQNILKDSVEDIAAVEISTEDGSYPDDLNASYLEDVCCCRCMCRRCTTPTSKTAATQTCWPSASKAIQVCPSTNNKGVMCKSPVVNKSVQVACHMTDVSTTCTPIAHSSCNPSFSDHNYADAMPESNIPHSRLVDKVLNESDDDDLSETTSDRDSDSDYHPSDNSDAWMDDEILTSARPSNEYQFSSRKRTYLIYEETLKKLFSRCQICGNIIKNLKFISEDTGTLLKVLYQCEGGHDAWWYSQPMLSGMAAGNLLMACAILLTGLTFKRIEEFCDILSLPLFCKTTFYSLQNRYLFPNIHEEFTKLSEAVMAVCGPPNNVSVVGDARCDSPGFSAKYGTYTVMEVDSGAILNFSLMHVGQSTSSVAMEKDGCRETLTVIEDHGLHISVLGTDRCSGVGKLMRTEFPHITHQYDVYHIEKGIRTKLLKLANQRGCYELHPWIKAVKNHLWYCCQNCDQNPEILKEKWMSIIYHVTNQHCWNMFDFVQRCDHPPLDKEQTRKKKWLKPDGPAHKAMKQVVLDAKLLKDIQRLNLCVHTSRLESYHALINKYCPKRQHFSYRGMVARTELAVLDHNNNLGRTQATTADGDLQYNTVCPKWGADWIAKPISADKCYDWRHELTDRVFKQRSRNLHPSTISVPDDIPKNIAKKDKPPKEDIIKKHISRFKRDS